MCNGHFDSSLHKRLRERRLTAWTQKQRIKSVQGQGL